MTARHEERDGICNVLRRAEAFERVHLRQAVDELRGRFGPILDTARG
jgi:hypothetical protein